MLRRYTWGDLTFAATGRDIVVCRRAHRVVTFQGHAQAVTHLFVGPARLGVHTGCMWGVLVVY
jgi:hypothetical protein